MTLTNDRKKTILAHLTNRQFRRRRIRGLWCKLADHDWLHVSVPHNPHDPASGRLVALVCFRCTDTRVIDVTADEYRRGLWDPNWRKWRARHPL